MPVIRGSGVGVSVRRPSRRAFPRLLALAAVVIAAAAMLCPLIPVTSAPYALAAEDAPGADFDGCPDGDSDGDARQACGIMNMTGPDGRKIADKGDTYDRMFGRTSGDGLPSSIADDTANHGLLEVWPMMAHRILGPGYYLNSGISTDAGKLNEAGGATHAWKPGRHCKSLDEPSSYTNDNCDIPGMMTQGVQDVLYSVLPHGIKGGERRSARSPYNIGVPVELIPDGKVPTARGSNRYTGLEILGYNLSWTTYVGEWDKIDVSGQTRFSSSISVLSGLGKAFQSVSAGVSKAAGNATADVSQAWNEGNLVKIAGSIVSWPFKTVFHGASNSTYDFAEILLNGYEDNAIHSPGAWNRDGFWTDTAYNVRVMSDQERGQVYLSLLQALIEDTTKTVADRYHVDVDDLAKQSAFPSGRPEKVVKPDERDKDGNVKKGPKSEREAWDGWVKRNAKRLDWGADKLKVDYKSFAPGDGGSASAQVDALKADWNGKASEWRTSEMKIRLKDNLDSYTNALAGGEIRDGTETMKQYARDSLASGSLFWVCTNADGSPQGQADNGIIKTAMSAGLRDPGLSAFDSKGEFRCKDSSGRVGALRQPISGGLFGQAGSNAQKAKAKDTRRTPGRTMTAMFDPVGAVSGFMLSASQKVAMGINFLVNIAFQPVMESLGLKPIILNVIRTLRDSFYLQLLILVSIISVFVALVKSLRSGPVEGLKSMILVLATAILGVALLTIPEIIFKAADEYPAYAERMVAAFILQADGSPDGDLCSSTQTPGGVIDASTYKDAHGSRIAGFSPDTTIRRVECNIWDAYVFEPWSLGQFGTGYRQLYAKGNAPSGSGSFQEDEATTKLVGSAPVNMGGGTVIHNWALYQASLQTSGTSTEDDPAKPAGVLDKDMYRLVDLQAGVNGAKGKDTSHWGAWRGSQDRFMVALLALASAIGGILSIGMFAMAKVSAMFVMAVLLALAPVMLLVGIIPGAPRRRMRSWMMQILGQALKRVVLTALLSVQLVIIIVIAGSNMSSPVTSMLFVCVASWMFVAYGRSILRAFLEPVENAGAGMFATDDRTRKMMHDSRFMTAIRNAGTSFGQMGGALVGATVAGGLVGQNTVRARMNRYEDQEMRKLDNARDARMKGVSRQREHLMDLYNRNVITGGEYRRRQHDLDASVSQIDADYRQGASHVGDYRQDVGKLADVLRETKVETEATRQIGRVRERTERLGRRRQNMLGHVRYVGDAVRAAGSERKTQISDAYRTIFINNPNVAAGLLGLDSAGQARSLRQLFPGVDFRDVADDLNLNASMSAEDVIEEMETLGYRFRKGSDGEFIPVFDPDTVAEARNRVSGNAAAADVRSGRVSLGDGAGSGVADRLSRAAGQTGPSRTAKLGAEFDRADAAAEQSAYAAGIARRYLPEDERRNEDTHSPTDAGILAHDPVEGLRGDSTAADVRAYGKMAESVDHAARKRVDEVMADPDMDADRKKEEKERILREADREKKLRSPSQLTVLSQAAGNAGNEIMKISDGLMERGYEMTENPKTGALSYRDTRTGRFREDMDGSERDDAAAAGADQALDDVAPIIGDYRQIDAAIRLHNPRGARPQEGRTGAIRYAMKLGEARAEELASGGRYAGGDHLDGIGTAIHGRPVRDPVADGLERGSDVAGGRGDSLTTAMTGAQRRAAEEERKDEAYGEERRKHDDADAQALDEERQSDRIRQERADRKAATGRGPDDITRPDTRPRIG